ncbi:MAG: hypothetical protein QCI38_07885, partial [Candidatus Thermoplasmatota archaeon]|nr:hypothetical protein [Candidatus Thermoplasmatota archaeon]
WRSLINDSTGETDNENIDMQKYNIASSTDEQIALYLNVTGAMLSGMKAPSSNIFDNPPIIVDETEQVRKNVEKAFFQATVTDDFTVTSVTLDYYDGSWHKDITMSGAEWVWTYETLDTHSNKEINYYINATDNAGQTSTVSGTIEFGAAPQITDNTIQYRINGQNAIFEARVTSLEGVTSVTVNYGFGIMGRISGDEFDGIYELVGGVHSDTTESYTITASDGTKESQASGTITFAPAQVATFTLTDTTVAKQNNGNALFAATTSLATEAWVEYDPGTGLVNRSMSGGDSGWTYTSVESFSDESLSYEIKATNGTAWLSKTGTITFAEPQGEPDPDPVPVAPSLPPPPFADSGMDIAYALLDTDGNAGTGYSHDGIGADYVVIVAGIDGAVHTRSLYEWKPNIAQWGKVKNIAAATGQQELEMVLSYGDMGLASRTPIRSAFIIMDWQSNQDSTPQEQLSFLDFHNVTNLGPNGFTVAFTTQNNVESAMYVGTSGNMGSATIASNPLGESKIHHLSISGLQPETEYLYYITLGATTYDNSGSYYSIKTPPVMGGTPPPSHIVYGQTTYANSLVTAYIRQDGGTNTSALISTYANGDGSYMFNPG